MLLAFDTATAFITACVYDAESASVLAEQDDVGPMKHGELLAPTIEGLLSQAGLVRQDLTAIAVGVGPGPYTGLRVGVVTARTLGYALDIPVYGVCSVDVLAEGLRASRLDPAEPFVATLDARRKELFWARYLPDGRRESGPFVDRPANIDAGDALVIGAGAGLYPNAFHHLGGAGTPRAADLARLVAEERAELYDPEPIYLRRPDAAVPAKPKAVS